ncbi:hypothetical protein B7P43_G04246 [Cryptotermes secundus]|uniref:MADF domain-containing protein n=1 Tax=Cryptotermes secundus TaxID=105785 RepID=A0A2J7PWA5_9NEOP|nr:uncharacterized protein LOC117282856 [Cryptotermes secundus]PNF20615.1 hypothetical protein B7P43_G04246 [Cryptotermes secundus]
MSGIDVNKELLIALIEERPVLWDKGDETYKDRNATKEAWNEVCLGLKEDFKTLKDSERNVFVKEVLKIWRNIRDAYARTRRKINKDKTSGAGAFFTRKYLYAEQLQFLSKLHCERETPDSLDSDKSAEENSDLPPADQEPSGLETNDQEAACFKKPSPRMGSKKRRDREPDHVEMRMLAALENETPNRHLSFFKGVIPSLEKFDDDEVIEFQMGVLQLVSNIKRRKRMNTSQCGSMSTCEGRHWDLQQPSPQENFRRVTTPSQQCASKCYQNFGSQLTQLTPVSYTERCPSPASSTCSNSTCSDSFDFCS